MSGNMLVDDIMYLSDMNKNKKNKWFDGENHYVVVSKPKIVKIQDVSKGENLSKVSTNEILDILPKHFHE